MSTFGVELRVRCNATRLSEVDPSQAGDVARLIEAALSVLLLEIFCGAVSVDSVRVECEDGRKVAVVERYSMVVAWSDRLQAYVVSFPEWEEQVGMAGHMYGRTYAEAVQGGCELLQLLVEDRRSKGKALPMPRVYAGAGGSDRYD